MLRKAAAILVLSVLTATTASADRSSKALAIPTSDASIKWGNCPPFFPGGCQIGVLNGDPKKPNSDLFFKMPAGAALPHHSHTSAERMVLVSGELKITYDGQDEVTLKPGMYAYGPPNLAHKGECVAGPEPCILFIAFEGPVDANATKQ